MDISKISNVAPSAAARDNTSFFTDPTTRDHTNNHQQATKSTQPTEPNMYTGREYSASQNVPHYTPGQHQNTDDRAVASIRKYDDRGVSRQDGSIERYTPS